MPIFGGEESETALAEPFEAPALAAFPEFAHVNFGPCSSDRGRFFDIHRGKLDHRSAFRFRASFDVETGHKPSY